MLLRRPRGGSRTRIALLLGLLSLVVYNANLREISSQDTIPARILPVAVIMERTVTLDMFFRDQRPDAPLPYWAQRANGHYVSAYPILTPLLALPIYAVPIALLGGDSWALVNMLAKLSSSLIAALSVALVFLAVTRLERDGVAAAVALVYALGTSTWSVSSQGLWAHGPAALFLATALCCLLYADERSWLLDAAGLVAGLMVAARSITALMAGAILGYVFQRDLRRGARALGLLAVAMTPFVAYNLWTFGALEGGYARMHADFKADGWAGTWSTPLWQGLAGLLVSPSRGLFVYSPILLIAVGGLVAALRHHPRRLLFGWLAAGLGASLLVLSKYSVWYGGASFGPRLLTDFLPALVMFLAPSWRWLERRASLKAAVTVLFIVSLGVQAIGAFYHPSPRELDWNTSPPDIPNTMRFWDWKDTQLTRLLRNGPRPMGFGSLE
jgi:hypothetical protein